MIRFIWSSRYCDYIKIWTRDKTSSLSDWRSIQTCCKPRDLLVRYALCYLWNKVLLLFDSFASMFTVNLPDIGYRYNTRSFFLIELFKNGYTFLHFLRVFGSVCSLFYICFLQNWTCFLFSDMYMSWSP